jgi:polysaccharide pyruvyl transferase WcaK-like protein
MEQHHPKIWLIGASFTTTNLGVSALAESSLKCIFAHWPNADVILRTKEDGQTLKFSLVGQTVSIRKRELEFHKHPLKTNNAYLSLFYALLLKLIPSKRFAEFLKARNPTFKDLIEADLVVDITAGDSFSDIYGMRQFLSNALFKWIVILCQCHFVFFPQTYGPFKRPLTQKVARYLLTHATAIYSRDQMGITVVKQLLGTKAENKVIQFVPDVAFVLDSEKPKVSLALSQLDSAKAEKNLIIGFNVSGLLFNSGQQANAQFDLKDDYTLLVNQIIQMFMAIPNTVVFLVPHVYATPSHIESDPRACRKLYADLATEYLGRLFMVDEDFNHRQVKYFIGQCDFFMGSRMHACIAAISQFVPAVGIAYSRKFIGVFESVGIGQAVADLRTQNNQELLTHIKQTFTQRQTVVEKLKATVPTIQQQVLSFLATAERKRLF